MKSKMIQNLKHLEHHVGAQNILDFWSIKDFKISDKDAQPEFKYRISTNTENIHSRQKWGSCWEMGGGSPSFWIISCINLVYMINLWYWPTVLNKNLSLRQYKDMIGVGDLAQLAEHLTSKHKAQQHYPPPKKNKIRCFGKNIKTHEI